MLSLFRFFKKKFASKVPEKDRVPFGQKLAYGAANPVEHLTVWMPKSVLTPVFNIGLGMDPRLIGIALAIWRAYDAIIDPVMGNISDNTRTRWGRRRPYIVVGAILTGCIMPLIWWAPRGASDTFLFVWLLGSGLLLYTAFTIWAMPYYSLQLEMTSDYNERTNVSAYRTFFANLFSVAGAWILALASIDFFADANGDPDLANGMRYIGIGMGALIILLGVLPGFFTKERYYDTEAAHQVKQKLFTSLKLTLTTRPFLILVLITLTQIFAMGLVGTLGFYINAYYVCEGDVALAATVQGGIQTALFLPSMFLIPFCSWIANRYGKKALLYLVTGAAIAGYVSAYIFFVPGKPWLQLVPALLKGVVGVGLWMIVPSMQADVADYDELSTHARREGSFSSIFSWSTKVAWTVTTVLSGFILAWTGFNVHREGAQPEHVLSNMLHFYVWLPVAFLILCLIAIKIYPLTHSKMDEIREKLEARRGTV